MDTSGHYMTFTKKEEGGHFSERVNVVQRFLLKYLEIPRQIKRNQPTSTE